MRFHHKMLIRLVEADVPVGAYAKKLKVDAAKAGNKRIVRLALCFVASRHAVWKVHVFAPDVDVVEKVRVHEAQIALLVRSGEPTVFIEVHRGGRSKGNVAFFVPFDELLVCADGRGACGKAQNACFFEDHLRGNHVCRLAAHIAVVLCNYEFHVSSLPSMNTLLRLNDSSVSKRSASLPCSMLPISLSSPMERAGVSVAAMSACSLGMPNAMQF